MQHDAHIFALYVPTLSSLLGNVSLHDHCAIAHPDLWQRIVRVLRLRADEKVILFDGMMSAEVTLLDATFRNQRTIHVRVDEREITQQPSRILHLWCGLLKRDAFEQVVYNAAAIGVSSIQPILSVKVQRSWGDQKEFERLQRIMIAACEQSKNFSLPTLKAPMQLSDCIANYTAQSPSQFIFFHETGLSLYDALIDIHSISDAIIVALVGPEGDYTFAEQKLLRDAGFVFVALTPTVLRSVEAMTIGVGSIKSVL